MDNYVVVLEADGIIEYNQKDDSEEMLDFCYRLICCDLIQIVHPKGLERPYCMIVDDEGLLKEAPMINVSGSYLYGMHEHLQPIVGNAIIMKEGYEDLELLSREEAENLMKKFEREQEDAFREIKAAYRKLVGGHV